TDAIKGFDRIEGWIDAPELAPDSLDVAVDGAVVDVDVVVIGNVEQLVARFHHARPLGERFQYQEFCHGEAYVLAVPPHLMTRRVHRQTAAFEHRQFRFGGRVRRSTALELLTAQNRTDS